MSETTQQDRTKRRPTRYLRAGTIYRTYGAQVILNPPPADAETPRALLNRGAANHE